MWYSRKCPPQRITKWKALKCQNLGAAVHMIVLVCWLELITIPWTIVSWHLVFQTLSCLLCAVYLTLSSVQFAQRFQTLSRLPHAFCFVPAYAKFTHKFLTLFDRPCATYLVADFTLSDSTALIRFIAFCRKLHSAFRLDRKTWSQRWHVFRLTGAAALHCGHTFVGGILTANDQ